MTKTAREVIENAIGSAILAGDDTLAGDIQRLRDNTLKELEAIIQGVIGEDDEPRNTLEHSRRNFMRTEQRQALHTALYGEEK